jgi:Transglycosylase SLT domain
MADQTAETTSPNTVAQPAPAATSDSTSSVQPDSQATPTTGSQAPTTSPAQSGSQGQPGQSAAPTSGAPASPQTTSTPVTAMIPQQQPTAFPPPPKGVPANDPNKNHFVVKLGSLMNTTALAMAGGQRVKETIDPDTGITKYTKIPMSRSDIGMAIAMTAISGALKGLTAKGPGANAQAAAMGFDQAAQQRTDADKKQSDQANADFSRHAQVLETNLKMYGMAQSIGQKDDEANDKYIEHWKSIADDMISKYSGHVRGVVAEQDLAKYHVTMDNAIPYKRVPLLDSDGKRVTNKFGIPASTIDYLIVDPGFKTDNILSKDDIDTLTQYGRPGFGNSQGKSIGDLPQDAQMTLSMGLSLKADANAIRLGADTLKNYTDTINSAKAAPAVEMKLPPLPEPAVQVAVDNAATKYGVPLPIAHGLVLQESGGHANVGDSDKGAQGITQLMPATAAQYKVKDPHDLTQNADGGMHYLSDLMKLFPTDPKLALAAYNAGPGSIRNGQIPNYPETQNYVNSISAMVGLNDVKAAIPGGDFQIDFKKALRDDPQLTKSLATFEAMSTKDGNYGEALKEMMKVDPTGVGKIKALLGGDERIGAYDQILTTRTQVAKDKEDVRKAVEMQAALAPGKLAAKEADDKAAADSKLESADLWKKIGIPADTPLRGMDLLHEVYKHDIQKGSTLEHIIHYELGPQGISNRQSERQFLFGVAGLVDPSFDDTNYGQKVEAKRAFASGKPADNVIRLNTLIQHTNELNKDIALLDNAHNYYWNVAKNAWRSKIGDDPRISNVNKDIAAVSGEAAALFKGTSGTDVDVQEWRKNINSDQGQNTLVQGVQKMLDLAAGRQRALIEQWNSQVATPRDIRILSPSSEKILIGMGRRDLVDDDISSYRGRSNSQYSSDLTGGRPVPNPASQASEQPVVVDGKTVGYTIDGKTFSRMAQ